MSDGLFATPWTQAHQIPLPMGGSPVPSTPERREGLRACYWEGPSELPERRVLDTVGPLPSLPDHFWLPLHGPTPMNSVFSGLALFPFLPVSFRRHRALMSRKATRVSVGKPSCVR